MDAGGGAGTLPARPSGLAPSTERPPNAVMPAVFAHTLAAKSDAPEDVARLAQLGEVITDNNQLLAYGPAR